MSTKGTMMVRIRDTKSIVFEGEADRVNTENEVGPLDVYPMHANFISILHNRLSVYKNKQKLKELTFEQAIMKVKSDSVHIFLGLEGFLLDEKSMTSQKPKTSTPPKAN